jgi:hypothetical protein
MVPSLGCVMAQKPETKAAVLVLAGIFLLQSSSTLSVLSLACVHDVQFEISMKVSLLFVS